MAPASSKSLAQSNLPPRTALPSGVSPITPAAASLSSNDSPICKSNDKVSAWPAPAASCIGERAGIVLPPWVPLLPPPCTEAPGARRKEVSRGLERNEGWPAVEAKWTVDSRLLLLLGRCRARKRKTYDRRGQATAALSGKGRRGETREEHRAGGTQPEFL